MSRGFLATLPTSGAILACLSSLSLCVVEASSAAPPNKGHSPDRCAFEVASVSEEVLAIVTLPLHISRGLCKNRSYIASLTALSFLYHQSCLFSKLLEHFLLLIFIFFLGSSPARARWLSSCACLLRDWRRSYSISSYLSARINGIKFHSQRRLCLHTIYLEFATIEGISC